MTQSSRYAVENPWAQNVEKVSAELGVSPDQGLGDGDVRENRRRFGPNRLKESGSRPAAAILLDQVKNLIIVLLAVAAGVSFAFGQRLEAVAILVAIVLNVAVGFFTELRATRSMESLQRLGRVAAKVRRGGRVERIAADQLVPGDVGGTQILLKGLPYGSHRVQARIRDDLDEVVASSPPVHFHLRKPLPESP